MSNPREDKATERPVSHDEAHKIAQRLINGSFRRDGESLEVGKRPQFSIPANRDRDDDLRICDYIDQQKAAQSDLVKALERMTQAFKPFTIKPMGGEGSTARVEQEEQIAAHSEARGLLASISTGDR